jgi:transposase-like protein
MCAVARRAAVRWAKIVAEAEGAGASHASVASKYRVALSTLRYQIYKARKSTGAVPRLLPVRIEHEPSPIAMLEAHVGAVRVNFSEGCSPSYVAAVLSALSKASC